MKPVLHFSGCEWLHSLAGLQVWWFLPLTLQDVSGCSSPMGFKPDDAYLGASGCEWLQFLALSSLMMPILGLPVCEWLQFFVEFQAWWFLSLALQAVSGCSPPVGFKPDDAYPWCFSVWVADIPFWVLSLMISILGSPECERLQFLPGFMPDDVYPLFASVWVSVVLCWVSSLMFSILGHSGCEWLQFPTGFQANWWCNSLVYQFVSGCSSLLGFKPHDFYPWPSRMWVTAASCWVLSLMMHILGVPVCEWLQFFAEFQAWWWLSLALQCVSGCSSLLDFKPDDANSWLSSVWVTAVSFWLLNLMMPIFGSSACEWLHFSAGFQASWQHLSLLSRL